MLTSTAWWGASTPYHYSNERCCCDCGRSWLQIASGDHYSAITTEDANFTIAMRDVTEIAAIG